MSYEVTNQINRLEFLQKELTDVLRVRKGVDYRSTKITAWCGEGEHWAGYRSVELPKILAQQVLDVHVQNLQAEIDSIQSMVEYAEKAMAEFKLKDLKTKDQT